MEQVQTQIDELRRKIEYHSNRYYNMDDPEITDYEYDMLMQQLKKIEKGASGICDTGFTDTEGWWNGKENRRRVGAA